MADLDPDVAARLAATAPLRRAIANAAARHGRPNVTPTEVTTTRDQQQPTLDLEQQHG